MPLPITPLDEALLFVMQKLERRIIARLERDEFGTAKAQEELRLACSDYNQIALAASDAERHAHIAALPIERSRPHTLSS